MKVPAYTKQKSCSHRFPIEIGTCNNIDQHLRQSTICDCNSIGDEFYNIL